MKVIKKLQHNDFSDVQYIQDNQVFMVCWMLASNVYKPRSRCRERSGNIRTVWRVVLLVTDLCFIMFLLSSIVRWSSWSLLKVSKASCFPSDSCGPEKKEGSTEVHVVLWIKWNIQIVLTGIHACHSTELNQPTLWTSASELCRSEQWELYVFPHPQVLSCTWQPCLSWRATDTVDRPPITNYRSVRLLVCHSTLR